MTLIKSISGIRGTIGGKPGEGLSPVDVIRFTSAFCEWVKENQNPPYKIVVGRDGRISGPLVQSLVISTVQSMGITVVDLDLATTPTVEMAVTRHNASAGIILTASHNPEQWNALKLLNNEGEFISASEGARVLQLAEDAGYCFCEVNELGNIITDDGALSFHCKKIIELPYILSNHSRFESMRVVVDAINSVGSFAVPAILEAMGVKRENIIVLNSEISGRFAHNPEPLPAHLGQICKMVVQEKADLGIVVDPDVDRLALICEDGSMFGEEYTLVSVADYLLKRKAGNAVSNLSSSSALRDVTHWYSGEYYASAVGEVNVVAKMKEVNAVIGGEGNGGVILPDLHYGRDSLVGIALFLSLLAETSLSCSRLREKYPQYFIAKKKLQLDEGTDVGAILERVKNIYTEYEQNTVDGLRIDFLDGWVHLRRSNTEPIIRIYAESTSEEKANDLAEKIIRKIKD